MPGFFEIKKGDIATIGLLISAVVTLFGFAMTVYYEMGGGPSGGGGRDEVVLKCAAEGCTHEEVIPREEYQERAQVRQEEWKAMLEAKGVDPKSMTMGMGMMGPMGPGGEGGEMQEPLMPWGNPPQWAMKCPTCGQDALFFAIKCEKCDKIYFEGTDQEAEYSDTCPDCGHSRKKIIMEKRKAERRSTRKKR
jgi:hypothetical protein